MTKSLTGKYFFTTFFAFAFFLFVFSFANAATYYVSPSGSDSNSGTEAQPFKNIQKAADIVNPGDTVIVKDGTYTDPDNDRFIVRLNRGGTLSNWITFKSENKWGAVLDGQNNAAGYGFIFMSSSINYIKIEGFEIKDTEWGAIWNNTGAHNLIFKGNHIHHTGRTYRGSGQPGYGALHTNGDNVIVDGNVIHTNGRLLNNPPYSTDKNQDHGIYPGGTDITIKNNIIYNHQAGWGIHFNGSSITNLNIVNNTFSGANPWFDGHIIVWNNPINLIIENNIFNEPRNNAMYSWNHKSSEVSFKNNLSSPGIGWFSSNSDPDLFTQSGNIQNQDPNFVDSTNNNYHLQNSSLAIDAGIAANAPTYDFNGNPRPQGNGYDIGAYEFVPAGSLPTCTSFTYSDWSPIACPSNQTQTRTTTSSSPQGCTGGTPTLTQSCTYTPTPPPTTTTSLANTTTMTANSQNFDSNHPVEHLWDGCLEDTSICSTGADNISSFWIEFDFTQNYNLTQAKLFGDAGDNWWSKDWTLKYRQNVTEEWQTAFNNVNAFLNDWSIQNLNNTTARYIRVEVNGNPDRPATQARELEIYGTPSSAQPPPTLKGDLDGNGAVNTLDWSIMNSKWNTADTQADLNNDGIVNTIDFSILNGQWGK